MIKPILLYGSDIWGFSQNIDSLEKIQLRFCKLLLKLKSCYIVTFIGCKNHRSAAGLRQTLSHYDVSSTPHHERDSNPQFYC
jgi:hypothetical protein